jgi:hypothetical protein
MAQRAEPWTQLAARIPRELHCRLKLYCVNDGSVFEIADA